MDEFTSDTFFEGRIKVRQQRKGYRFSIDAVLLAWQAGLYQGNTIIDLGTGCGIIPLILAFRNPDAQIYGVEIQEELADTAISNVKENHFENRISILCRDMKKLARNRISGTVDIVVSNPPYRKANSGRINPNGQKAIARHEIKASLSDIVNTARRMLDISGRFITVYPVERLAELLSQMQALAIEPKYMRLIYSGWNTEAKLVLAEGVKGGRPGMKAGPPLIIYEADGSYTQEVNRMFMP